MKLWTHWVIACYVSAFAALLALALFIAIVVGLCTGAIQLH